jgi:hypothetical protein
MKNSIEAALVSLFIAVIGLNSCENVLVNQPHNSPDSGKGYVAVTLTLPQSVSGGLSQNTAMAGIARTVSPDMDDIIRFELSFAGSESAAPVPVDLGANNPVELAAGSWTVTVTAFTDRSAIARGSAVITVVAGETVETDIFLGPVTVGTGYFAYSITVPNGAAGSLVITTPEGAPVSGGNISLATNSINSRTVRVPAGQYLMRVNLSRDETQAGKTEVLHIYPDKTSRIEYVFSEDDFRFVADLSENTWAYDTLAVPGDIRWYQFMAAYGTNYQIQWDKNQDDSAKTVDITVSAYGNDGGSIFTNVDSGWISPQVITGVSGTIYLKVQGFSADTTGTYAIKYGVAVPVPNAPTVRADMNMLTVEWTAVEGASAYEVWMGTSNDITQAAKYGDDISSLSVEISGLINGTTYYVRVKAKTSEGTISGFSTGASGKPESFPVLYDGVIDTDRKMGLFDNLAAISAYLSSNAETGHHYYIVLRQDEPANSIALSFPYKTVGITIQGDTAERKINLDADTALFTVNAGVTLTLGDKITLAGRGNSTNSLVKVDSDGTLVMQDGAKICDNTAINSSGGGVYVHSGGTFTMSGGEISGNTSSSSGGGVYIDVGNGGTFIKTLSGGIIYGSTNTTHTAGSTENTSTNGNGHAVYVGSSPSKKRNTNAGLEVALDSSKVGTVGGWE